MRKLQRATYSESKIPLAYMCLTRRRSRGRKAISRQWEEITTRPRGCVQATTTSQRTAGVDACVRIAHACERVSLSSVVHISVVRCTLFRCLRRARPGRARRRQIPRYCFFFPLFRTKGGRIRICEPSSRRMSLDDGWTECR